MFVFESGERKWTGTDGIYSLTRVKDAHVLFRHIEYKPEIRKVAELLDRDVLLTKSVVPDRSIPSCAKPSRGPKELYHPIRIPRGTRVRRVQDVDYVKVVVEYRHRSGEIEFLIHGEGPLVSTGLPVGPWGGNSETATATTIECAGLPGLDLRIETTAGRRWRFLSQFQTHTEYRDVSKSASEFFDSILDTMCCHTFP